jgi:hypothetical protein
MKNIMPFYDADEHDMSDDDDDFVAYRSSFYLDQSSGMGIETVIMRSLWDFL